MFANTINALCLLPHSLVEHLTSSHYPPNYHLYLQRPPNGLSSRYISPAHHHDHHDPDHDHDPDHHSKIFIKSSAKLRLVNAAPAGMQKQQWAIRQQDFLGSRARLLVVLLLPSDILGQYTFVARSNAGEATGTFSQVYC